MQDVTISYNYIGILPANLLYDVMNGKAARSNHAASRKHYYTVLLDRTLRRSFYVIKHINIFAVFARSKNFNHFVKRAEFYIGDFVFF